MEYLGSIVDYGVIGLLGLMSVMSLYIFIERLLSFKSLDIKSFSKHKTLELELNKNMTTLATIASNAPYLGLLGTVLAIMQTFVNMAQTGVAASLIMSSLALALKTTAIGLFVAILAVVFYNILNRRIEIILAKCPCEEI